MKGLFFSLVVLICLSQMTNGQELINFQIAGIDWTNGKINNNEPSVAINPVDNDNIIIATNYRIIEDGCDNPLDAAIGIFTSTDRGNTWSLPLTLPQTRNLQLYADPSIAFTSSGTAYCGYVGVGGNTSLIFVNVSSDGGQNWSSSPFEIAYETSSNLTNDKPYIHIDKINNKIYVAFTEIDDGTSIGKIKISHYDDVINDFSPPIGESNPGTETSKLGSVPITDKEGNVFVVYHKRVNDDYGEIWVTKSTDFGNNFSSSSLISSITNIGFKFIIGDKSIYVLGQTSTQTFRVNNFPSAAVDLSDGPYEKFKTIGVGSDIQLLFRLANEIGIGVGLYGNLNFANNYAGININITIGNGK